VLVAQLTTDLLKTYKHINEVYYKKKRERQRQRNAQRRTYDYEVKIGEMLHLRYKVLAEVGKGSFGQVVKAYDTQSGLAETDIASMVAIKVIKSKDAFRRQAKTEVQLLELLNSMDPSDQWGIVQLKEVFDHGKHVCLVFEHLSFNLFELLKRMKFAGVSLNLIAKFARQILKTLAFLSLPDIDVVHCDLKPENILVRQPSRSAIKVIDFGSSCKRTERMYSYIQSRFYRSPEVVLGLPYDQAIDMWSLGCILVELHTGVPLFAGRDEMDQMHRFVALKGLPPRHMLDKGRKTTQFFFKEKQTWDAIPEAVAPPALPETDDDAPRDSADLFTVPGIPASAWEVRSKSSSSRAASSSSSSSAAAAAAAATAFSSTDPRTASAFDSATGPPSSTTLTQQSAVGTRPPALPPVSGVASASASAASSSASSATAALTPTVKDDALLIKLRNRRRASRYRAMRNGPLPFTYSLKPRSERLGTSHEQTVYTDLRQVLGVHTHGPKGRRRGEATGHTERHYELFLDLVESMLEWDPKKRIKPMQALNHPFLREGLTKAGAAAGSAASEVGGGDGTPVVEPETAEAIPAPPAHAQPAAPAAASSSSAAAAAAAAAASSSSSSAEGCATRSSLLADSDAAAEAAAAAAAATD
jgi:dual specificity tyrosine-phosphorylation-regulated kinase 1